MFQISVPQSIRQLMAVGSVALVGALATTSASAQFYNHPALFRHAPPAVYELNPRQLMAAVSRQGFRPETGPVYDEEIAFLTATDAAGNRSRLAVDTYSGQIVQRRPLQPRRDQQKLAQRVPGSGAVVATPPSTAERKVSTAPEKVIPVRPDAAKSPVTPPPLRPKALEAAPKPPASAKPAEAVAASPKPAPRRIEFPAPAALDGIGDQAPRGPSAPINSVPPAPLE